MFFYNECHLSGFSKIKNYDNKIHGNWIQPFICGFVKSRTCMIKDQEVTYCVIAKKDKSRSGLRLLSRGGDEYGNVSNFAESEQILVINSGTQNKIGSYVQIRGS